MCLLMVKKCTEAAVDAVVLEVRWLVTVAVMGVQAAASMGGGVGGGWVVFSKTVLVNHTDE